MSNALPSGPKTGRASLGAKKRLFIECYKGSNDFALNFAEQADRFSQWFMHWSGVRDIAGGQPSPSSSRNNSSSSYSSSFTFGPSLLASHGSDSNFGSQSGETPLLQQSSATTLPDVPARQMPGVKVMKKVSMGETIETWMVRNSSVNITLVGSGTSDLGAVLNSIIALMVSECLCETAAKGDQPDPKMGNSNPLAVSSPPPPEGVSFYNLLRNFIGDMDDGFVFSKYLCMNDKSSTSFRNNPKAKVRVDWDEEQGKLVQGDDACTYLLPQGRGTIMPATMSVKFGHILCAKVAFMNENDLRCVLWYWIEMQRKLKHGETVTRVSRESCEIMSWLFQHTVTGTQYAHNWRRKEDIILAKTIRPLLGKTFTFAGQGESFDSDRVYVRDQLRKSCSAWGYMLVEMELLCPAPQLKNSNSGILALNSDFPKHFPLWKSFVESVKTCDVCFALTSKMMNGAQVIDVLSEGTLNVLFASELLGPKAVTGSPCRLCILSTQDESPKLFLEQIKNIIKDEKRSQEFCSELPFFAVDPRMMFRNIPPSIFFQCSAASDTHAKFLRSMVAAVSPSRVDICLNFMKNSLLMSCGGKIREFSESWIRRLIEDKRRDMISIKKDSSSSDSSSSSSGMLFPERRSAEHVQIPTEKNIEQLSESFRTKLKISQDKDHTFTLENVSATLETKMKNISDEFMQKIKITGDSALVNPHHIRVEGGYVDGVPITTGLMSIKSFREASIACYRLAKCKWPKFREQFLKNSESCRIVLNPKYRGKCLGADLSELMCGPLKSFSFAYTQYILFPAVKEVFHSIQSVGQSLVSMCTRFVDKQEFTRIKQLHIKQMLWQTQESIDRLVHNLRGQVKKEFDAIGLGEGLPETISTLCRDVLVSDILTQTKPTHNCAAYYALITNSFYNVPLKCAINIGAFIQDSFTRIVAPKISHMQQMLLKFVETFFQNFLSQGEDFGEEDVDMEATQFGDSQYISLSDVSSTKLTSNICHMLSAKTSMARSVDTKQFYSHISAISLCTKSVKRDHNSLFRSVSSLLFGSEQGYMIVRYLTIMEILDNPSSYLHFIRPAMDPMSISCAAELERRAEFMSRKDIMNDNMCLYAIAAFTHMNIIIFSPHFQGPILVERPPNGAPRNTTSNDAFGRILRSAIRVFTGKKMLPLALVEPGTYAPLLYDFVGNTAREQAPAVHKAEDFSPLLRKMKKIPDEVSDVDMSDSEDMHMTAAPRERFGCGVPSLRDLCIRSVAQNIAVCAEMSDKIVLPTGVVTQIIEQMVNDNVCDAVDMDIFLMKFLHRDITELNLSNCPYLSKYNIAEIAKSCPILTNLSLSNCPNVDTECMSVLLSGCCDITFLDLSYCSGVNDDVLALIAKGLKKLSFLNLSGCAGVSNRGIARLSALRVKELGLNDCPSLTDRAFEELSGIETLCVKGCDGVTDNLLYTLCQTSPSIRMISLSAKKITEKAFLFFLARAKQIECIELENVQVRANNLFATLRGNNKLLQQLSLSIAEPGMSTDLDMSGAFATDMLSVLNLDGSAFLSDALLGSITTQTPTITCLSLAKCTSLTAAGIVRAISPLRLSQLVVNGCATVDDSVVHKVVDNSLDVLEDMQFSATSVTESSLRALSMCENLRVLDCSFCERIGDKGFTELCKKCRGLERVAIEGCSGLTDRAIQVVSLSCNTLVSLNCASCENLTDKGLFHLFKCRKIDYLDVSYCPRITPDKVNALLLRLDNLREFHIRGFSCPKKPNFRFYLPKSLRKIDLSWARNCPIDDMIICIISHAPHIQSVNLTKCSGVSDDSVRLLASCCTHLAELFIPGCTLVQDGTTKFLALSGIRVTK